MATSRLNIAAKVAASQALAPEAPYLKGLNAEQREAVDRPRREGVALNNLAILVRASFQMRAFEDRFVTMGMPNRVIGGPRFYDRQEIKDAIAYLEVMQNPVADLKFERIINVPKRGLGDQTLQNHLPARSRRRVEPVPRSAPDRAKINA